MWFSLLDYTATFYTCKGLFKIKNCHGYPWQFRENYMKIIMLLSLWMLLPAGGDDGSLHAPALGGFHLRK